MNNTEEREKSNNFNRKGVSDASTAGSSQIPITRIKARKVPRQKRSKELVEAILEAAAQIFAELGYARATTNKIAERAGVSVGSLYQYFPNKDSLIASLYETHHTSIHGVVGDALKRFGNPSIGLEDGLRCFLEELNNIHESNPTLTKALSREVIREADVDANSHADDEESAEEDKLGKLLFSRSDVRDGDPAVITPIMGQVISHLTRWLLHDAPKSLDRNALREETVQLLFRYLKK